MAIIDNSNIAMYAFIRIATHRFSSNIQPILQPSEHESN